MGECRPPSAGSCADDPPGWLDAAGYACLDYEILGWCTINGGIGAGWERSRGALSDFRRSNRSAKEACCSCGGGSLRGQATLNQNLEPLPVESCKDISGWTDDMGFGCHSYEEGAWCTPSGGFGRGWSAQVYGPFRGKPPANKACCACGRGKSQDVATRSGSHFYADFDWPSSSSVASSSLRGRDDAHAEPARANPVHQDLASRRSSKGAHAAAAKTQPPRSRQSSVPRESSWMPGFWFFATSLSILVCSFLGYRVFKPSTVPTLHKMSFSGSTPSSSSGKTQYGRKYAMVDDL